MNDNAFKKRWKEQGPGLPAAPPDTAARFWARAQRSAGAWRPWILRPALGALLLAAGFWLGLRQGAGVSEVRFRLTAPRAQQVALSGSFNGWRPAPMRRDGDDWTLDLRLKPGRHRYVFVLNGRRSLPDPEGGDAVLDEDGQAQSVIDLPKTQTL
jgi:hypothetical protein